VDAKVSFYQILFEKVHRGWVGVSTGSLAQQFVILSTAIRRRPFIRFRSIPHHSLIITHHHPSPPIITHHHSSSPIITHHHHPPPTTHHHPSSPITTHHHSSLLIRYTTYSTPDE
jgi:hypothetical protein